MSPAAIVILGLLGQDPGSEAPRSPARVGSQVAEPKKLKHVAPRYPEDARRAGLTQAVVLECVIDPRGAVSRVDVLDGVPPLTDAALSAVRQWRYTPTLLDGVAVPVIMTVTVNFKLSETRYHDLLDSLDSENAYIRHAAARNLGVLRVGSQFDESDRRRAIRALERVARDDPSLKVRDAAASSLTRIDGRPLPPELHPPPPTPRAGVFTAGTTRPMAWGVFVDPLGQSAVEVDEDRIQIDVPARQASIEQGQQAAPRLMKPVVGDFAAEVRAGPLPRPRLPGRASHSAGLLLRQDDGNLVRLESAMVGEADSSHAVRYVLFEVRQGGQALDVSPVTLTLEDASVDLRLERRASELLALVSQKGETWREVARVTLALPEAMEIGVTAVNTGGASLNARFQGFVVSKAVDRVAERPLLPPTPVDPSPPVADADLPQLAAPAEPDAPPRVLNQARPSYPQDAFLKRIEGTVLIEALIDLEGRVARCRVLQSVPELDAAALAAVRQWRFQPARKGGKPVATIIHMPVAFRIYDKKE
jgi:TonB family protein